MTAATWTVFLTVVGFTSMAVSIAVNASGYTAKRKMEGALAELLVGMILIPCVAAAISSGMSVDPVNPNQVMACSLISALLGILIGDPTSKGKPRRVAERFSWALWHIAKVLLPTAIVLRGLVWAFGLTGLHSYFVVIAFVAGVVAFAAAVARTIHVQYEEDDMTESRAQWAAFVIGALCLFILA